MVDYFDDTGLPEKLPAGEEDAREAMQAVENYFERMNQLGSALENGDFESARELYQKALHHKKTYNEKHRDIIDDISNTGNKISTEEHLKAINNLRDAEFDMDARYSEVITEENLENLLQS